MALYYLQLGHFNSSYSPSWTLNKLYLFMTPYQDFHFSNIFLRTSSLSGIDNSSKYEEIKASIVNSKRGIIETTQLDQIDSIRGPTSKS